MGEVWRLYEGAADEFERDRRRLAGEATHLGEIATRLGTKRRRVLDLGCGTGVPVAGHLIDSGLDVTGVDAAPAMIAKAGSRFPGATWLVRDMRGLDLSQAFDAILAWDSFFHLTPDDQRAMFAVFGAHAAAGALLLFTSGPSAGVAMGKLYGHDLYHASLSAEEYRELLGRHGFAVVRHSIEDPTWGGHTVWLAERRAEALSGAAHGA